MREFAPKVSRRNFLTAATTIAASLSVPGAESSETNAPAGTNTNAKTAPPKGLQPIQNLNDLLEPLRAAGKVPALAASVIVEGKIKGVGAVGIRKGGSPIPVKGTDLWHIGSCTKSMTATLIAMQVEKRKMRWDMTIAETLPELRDSMNVAYRDVTVEQLLQHRGGLSTKAETKLWERAWAQSGTPQEQRMDFVKGTLGIEPEAPPGSKYIYSNQGYAVAGVMLERTLGTSWENLMRTQLFAPLSMTMSGFGVPGTIGQIDQPWGHKWKNGKLEPQQADNPPAIGPAGTVHGSIWDLSRYTLFHLSGANGESRLLKPETFAKLHTPPDGQDYAMGWSRQDRAWAQGYTLNHNGSNTLNFATFWLAPKIKFAAVICTNIGGDGGEKTCDDVAQALIKKYALPS